ncbi:unannotated protein [freshwater metagenome]|uniref:Unannotated protein n=2 Tax=root TaxID=1 RepID=A0A6J7K4I4_9ZZZZ|nr:sigma-70 family RNA polymerase sigma factor [Actinomycetota bacterium]
MSTRRERIDNDLLRRYQGVGDLQARERLVERCMPLVRSVARRYAGRGQDPEDLTQAGLVGLTNAIERYDAGRGGRFVSYAVPNIQGEIRKHFRDRTWAVHVPRAVQELDARLQRARTQTLQLTGREAGVDDLAQMLDVTTDEVEDAQAAGRSYRALSLDHPAKEGAEPFAAHGAVDPGFARVENVDVIERAMRGIDERDRQVVRWAFGDGLLQREIGERIGVSQMQVSRILKAALARMGDYSLGRKTA